MGGAIFVSAGESILSNRLLKTLAVNVPQLDSVEVLNLGASGLQTHFSSAVLTGVLTSYMSALKSTFALGIALAVAAVVASLGPPVRSIKNGRGSPAGAA